MVNSEKTKYLRDEMETVEKVINGGNYVLSIYSNKLPLVGLNFGYNLRMKDKAIDDTVDIITGDGYSSEDELIEDLSVLSTALSAIFG